MQLDTLTITDDMDDETLANRIHDIGSHLNYAVAVAQQRGMVVEINVVPLWTEGSEAGLPRIRPRVLRPLGREY